MKEFKVGKEVSTIGFFSSPKAFEHETFARFAGGEISGSFGVSFDEKVCDVLNITKRFSFLYMCVLLFVF